MASAKARGSYVYDVGRVVVCISKPKRIAGTSSTQFTHRTGRSSSRFVRSPTSVTAPDVTDSSGGDGAKARCVPARSGPEGEEADREQAEARSKTTSGAHGADL